MEFFIKKEEYLSCTHGRNRAYTKKNDGCEKKRKEQRHEPFFVVNVVVKKLLKRKNFQTKTEKFIFFSNIKGRNKINGISTINFNLLFYVNESTF